MAARVIPGERSPFTFGSQCNEKDLHVCADHGGARPKAWTGQANGGRAALRRAIPEEAAAVIELTRGFLFAPTQEAA